MRKSVARAIVALGLLVPAALTTSAAFGFSGTQQEVAVAHNGIDLVSFFDGSPAPRTGSASFAVTHAGKSYRFASQANADRFAANPVAFLPQYAGHCAWAAAQGSIAPGYPQFARVVDGKLYFNYNAEVQATWLTDISGFIASANRNWPNIANQAS